MRHRAARIWARLRCAKIFFTSTGLACRGGGIAGVDPTGLRRPRVLDLDPAALPARDAKLRTLRHHAQNRRRRRRRVAKIDVGGRRDPVRICNIALGGSGRLVGNGTTSPPTGAASALAGRHRSMPSRPRQQPQALQPACPGFAVRLHRGFRLRRLRQCPDRDQAEHRRGIGDDAVARATSWIVSSIPRPRKSAARDADRRSRRASAPIPSRRGDPLWTACCLAAALMTITLLAARHRCRRALSGS